MSGWGLNLKKKAKPAYHKQVHWTDADGAAPVSKGKFNGKERERWIKK
jgi:hypothetical protein